MIASREGRDFERQQVVHIGYHYCREDLGSRQNSKL